MATDTTLKELVINDYTSDTAVIPETLPADELSLTPDTSLEKVVHDATLSGEGTENSPLTVVGGSGSGLPDQTGHTGFLETNGTTASWSDKKPLVNDAAAYDSLAIGTNVFATGNRSICLGTVTTVSNGAIGIGNNIIVSGTRSICLGHGYGVGSDYTAFINVGGGTTPVKLNLPNHLVFRNQNGTFSVIKEDGTIPTERLAADGTAGQVLSKTDTGMAWIAAPSGSGGASLSKGDYCTTYGIITLPSTITTNATENVLNMPGGIVMKTPNGRVTSSSSFTHTVTSTTDFTLFYAGGQWLECGQVDYSESTPVDDGVDNYQAWWNGTVWQFKSNDSGNVWREVESATPVCDCFFTGTNLTRIETVGYVWGHGVNKAQLDGKATKITDFMTPLTSTNKGATKAEIDSINMNIDSLYEEVGEKLDTTTAASTYATNTDAVHKTGDETIAGIKTLTDDLVVKSFSVKDGNNKYGSLIAARVPDGASDYIDVLKFGVESDETGENVGITVQKNYYHDSVSEYRTFAQTPYANSNNTEIATTEWCRGHGILVASQMPSEANNYTWYRKYSDGWIEQGGRVGGHATTSITVTFPTPFINNAYTVAVTRVAGSSVANGTVVVLFDQFTSTSFQYVYTGGSGGSQWMACGY